MRVFNIGRHAFASAMLLDGALALCRKPSSTSTMPTSTTTSSISSGPTAQTFNFKVATSGLTTSGQLITYDPVTVFTNSLNDLSVGTSGGGGVDLVVAPLSIEPSTLRLMLGSYYIMTAAHIGGESELVPFTAEYAPTAESIGYYYMTCGTATPSVGDTVDCQPSAGAYTWGIGTQVGGPYDGTHYIDIGGDVVFYPDVTLVYA